MSTYNQPKRSMSSKLAYSALKNGAKMSFWGAKQLGKQGINQVDKYVQRSNDPNMKEMYNQGKSQFNSGYNYAREQYNKPETQSMINSSMQKAKNMSGNISNYAREQYNKPENQSMMRSNSYVNNSLRTGGKSKKYKTKKNKSRKNKTYKKK